MKLKGGLAIVKIGSHRARGKLKSLIGRLPQGYFSWDRKGEWREVTQEELDAVKNQKIKGITQSQWKDDLHQCISFY